MDFTHYQFPNFWGTSLLSHINMAPLEQTCGHYLRYGRNLGWLAKSEIPRSSGIFPTFENQALVLRTNEPASFWWKK